MSAIVIGTFLVLAGAAAAFAVWPVLRWKDRLLPQRALAGAAAALFILGVGVGTYLMIGSPSLAVMWTKRAPSNTNAQTAATIHCPVCQPQNTMVAPSSTNGVFTAS